MKIRVADLPSRPKAVACEWPPEWVRGAIDAPEVFRKYLPCGMQAEVYLIEDTFVCRGTVHCRAVGECSRCLKEATVDLGGPLDLVQEPRPVIGRSERHDEDDEDLDFGYYDGYEVDLDHFVGELLALNVPMRALCSENCKGLCPTCGKDLNEGPCGCPPG